MSDTSDTGTHDTGQPADTGDAETADTGTETSEGTVEAGGAEEVILVIDGEEIDVTDRPNDAFPPGSTVPEQQQSTSADDDDGRPTLVAHQRDLGTTSIGAGATRGRVTGAATSDDDDGDAPDDGGGGKPFVARERDRRSNSVSSVTDRRRPRRR